LAEPGNPLDDAQLLIESGKPGEAIRLLEGLHEAGRGGLLLQTMRVRAFVAAGEMTQALAIARESAMLYPNVAVVAVSLGEALLAAGLLPTAIGEFQRALRLDPDIAEARFQLGCAWLEAGEAEKADEAFAAIPPDADFPELGKKRVEVAAMRTRSRADGRYVRHLFDQFSVDYDVRMLGQLGYGAPGILRSLAGLVGLTLRDGLAILDLGCGTGLAGAAFADLAARLDGIDLSPAMIAKAEARNIYDALYVGDIESAIGDTGRPYDLVLAADTLVYLGHLAPVFLNAAAALTPRGMFLFTVERKDGDGYDLGPKRRWRHSETYLRRQAEIAGFDIAGFLECQPRTEAGQPVEGYAVALSRS
jgi:predicted TPR repeat methyltransferase